MTEVSDLFKPNNHSRWEVVWSEVDEAQAEKVRELLRTAYGWDAVRDIKKSGAWEVQSKNYRVVVVEDGVERTVLVKKNPSGHTEGRLLLVERALVYLKQKGIPVPEVVSAKDGKSHVAFDGTNWQIFSFILGDYFRGTEEELGEAARWIARLHVAFAQAPFAEEAAAYGKAVAPWSTGAFSEMFEAAARVQEEVSHRLTTERAFLEQVIGDAAKMQDAMAGARHQVVRNSLHPHDTLLKEGKLQGIIDFEEIGEGELLRDVGNACHRFVRQYVVCQGKPWPESLSRGVRLFLETYQTVNPLSQEELRLMPFFIVDELLRKLASAAGKMATQEKPGTYEAEVMKFIDLLKEAEVVGMEIRAFAEGLS